MSHITLVCSMLVLMPFPCPPRDPRPSFPPLNSSVENVSPSEPVCHRHGRQASSISDKRSFGGMALSLLSPFPICNCIAPMVITLMRFFYVLRSLSACQMALQSVRLSLPLSLSLLSRKSSFKLIAFKSVSCRGGTATHSCDDQAPGWWFIPV